MSELTSNQRGQVAQLMASVDMARRGYNITPATEGLEYDLVAERDGKTTLVQVKTVRHRERDGVDWRVIDCTNGNRESYSKVDLYAAYDPQTEKVLYITHDDLDGKKELWLHPSKLFELE